MRILVTGGHGFVGRYLIAELEEASHEVIAPPHAELDVVDRTAIEAAVVRHAPDAVAHLAGVAFGPDVQRDPMRAFELAVAGTANVLESCRKAPYVPIVLVTGSAGVYGAPRPGELPIREDAPLRPRSPYALSKLAQECVALAYAERYGQRVIVTRAFNHSGAGQRPVFVLPALAQRIRDVAAGRVDRVAVGNLDVGRDFLHVRDVVRAYRLLLEAAAAGQLAEGGVVFNVASGKATSIRSILDAMCRLADVKCVVEVDPRLVRQSDAPETRGDASALRNAVQWAPTLDIDRLIEDVWEESSVSAV